MTATPRTTGELPPGYQLGGFVIEEIAGRGAMGVVYRASQPALGRLVALKVIAEPLVSDAAFRERFEREARAAAALGHPNIVSVHEAGQIDGTLYIAMQWVDGGDLRHHIGKTGPLLAAQAARVVSQIAEALDVAHAAGVLHRDVKPANILLRQMPSGLHAYLTDFGVTRPFVELSSGTDTLTQSGHIVGTPGFLAPEQIEGRDVDGRADLYALGCVLFEALTGRPPFQHETAVATLLAHTSAPRPRVSEANPNVGPAFDDLVRRALAIDREDRFANGLEMIAAIDEALKRRLPPVKPLVHKPIDGLSTEIERPQQRPRIVVRFDDDPEPAPAPSSPHPPAPPATARPPVPSWPAPAPASAPHSSVPPPSTAPVFVAVPAVPRVRSRGRTNMIVLLLGLLLIVGALVAFAISRGGDERGGGTTTDAPAVSAALVAPPGGTFP